MRITYTLMFHRQIFYIVSLTKVGNDKWKNKRKDKFFNMVVPSGSFRYKRQQKQQDTTEQASLAQQAEPVFSPSDSGGCTRFYQKMAEACRSIPDRQCRIYDKKRAGNSMSCLPEVYIKRNLRGMGLIPKQQRGLQRLQRS